MRKPLPARASASVRVQDDLLLILAELRLKGFLEADGLGGDDVHQRPALDTGENDLVELLRILRLGEDRAAAWSAQRLVGGGGDEIRVGKRAGMGFAAISPAMCAISTISSAPLRLAMAAKRSKSRRRG